LPFYQANEKVGRGALSHKAMADFNHFHLKEEAGLFD